MANQDEHKHDPNVPPSVHDEDVLENPEADDDVGEMVEELTGKKPKPGESFNDMFERTENEDDSPSKDETV